MITVVTAYVPLPDHPRSEQEFDCLGRQLLDIDYRVLLGKGGIEQCWLYQYLLDKYGPENGGGTFTHSVGDNPKKNSLYYHIVMAQKTEWLEIATAIDPFSDVFVWIDYGIFHLPGMTKEIVDSFLDRAKSEQAIAIPGCWTKDQYTYNDQWPYWRFCGGVMVVPRQLAQPFNEAMKREYKRWLEKKGNVSWEVNALARLEQEDPDFPVWWYAADHDQTMFTNYRATEYAEGSENVLAVQGRT